MKAQAGLIFGIMFLLLGCEDQPEKLIMPDDIDISVTDTGIVSIPSGVDPILISIFSRYSKIIASNGKPIHIFAQSEVSDQQIISARDILEFYLFLVSTIYRVGSCSYDFSIFSRVTPELVVIKITLIL